jgi:hypothetical protein
MRTTRRCIPVLISTIALIGTTQAIAEHLCRPTLTLDDIEFSKMIPPTLERVWSGVVSVDASQCATNAKGKFEIVFTRLSENAPDLEFREQYMWSAPSSVWLVPLSVGVTFAADEAVAQYRIENITPCACRH